MVSLHKQKSKALPPPRLLLGTAGIPAQKINTVVRDWRTSVVLRSLPGQSESALSYIVDLEPCWRIRRICIYK